MVSASSKATKKIFLNGFLNSITYVKIFAQINGILEIKLQLWTYIFIFKGNNFFITGKLSIKVYQKPENRYMYIPYKSAHPRHTIKNYVIGELKRYARINTEELNFLILKNSFFLRMRNRGFSKHKLSHWFSEVKYFNRAKFPCKKYS